MTLTPAQLQTLKADIAANTATVIYNGVSTPINAVPNMTAEPIVVGVTLAD